MNTTFGVQHWCTEEFMVQSVLVLGWYEVFVLIWFSPKLLLFIMSETESFSAATQTATWYTTEHSNNHLQPDLNHDSWCNNSFMVFEFNWIWILLATLSNKPCLFSRVLAETPNTFSEVSRVALGLFFCSFSKHRMVSSWAELTQTDADLSWIFSTCEKL